MNIQRAAPVNELLAKLIFLILPTALVGWFLLYNANVYYAILNNQALQQALYFGVGMAVSALFYAFRFRFLLPFLGLLLTLFLFQKGIDNLAAGEFDSFFLSVQFRVFAILFSLGWVFGWGFLRLRFFSIIVSALLLMASIAVIAKMQSSTVARLLYAFSPVAVYSVYIIFAAEQIYSYDDKSQKFWWFLTRRFLAFGAVVLLLLGGVVYLMRGQIKETVANFGSGGKSGQASMLKQRKDGTFDLKDYSRLQSSLGRNNELLFCAHIDNYFEGTDIPNPLYLTAFYYTKFDTATETFERDSTIPLNDLFTPNPAALPLFATQFDTMVLHNAMTEKAAKEVSIEVYSRKLSPETYLAPHTGYFVQPITVEKDFRDSFKTAFRAKSIVSELNSAYFVYNAKDPQIKAFQEKRFEVLRKVSMANYAGTDAAFMKYYTYMPQDAKFQNITRLAAEVTAKAKTPVDKIIAIRDWFLSKDAGGQPLFKYTDNPGVPDIPSASKLQYFLFENRKGYCAYFAGATNFMLRSLGIPSRIAVGFLTVNRSDKNKGWYWYYADQAHAWVQVYFPGYGWLDFDTTVGNDEAQESPKPDGTPPMQPPRAWLAADGVVESVDTVAKRMRLSSTHFVFHDKEYLLSAASPIELDVHIASIRRDSAEVPLSNVRKGDSATAVSYADAFKNMGPAGPMPGATLLRRFPSPAPIDEVYLRRLPVKKEKDQQPVVKQDKEFSWRDACLAGLGILGGLVLLLFALPALILAYYHSRYRSAAGDSKAYWAYRAAGYYLHMTGMPRGGRTPMQYARDTDARFGTRFSGFMNHYLKLKYARQPLSASERSAVRSFYKPLVQTVNRQVPFAQRLVGWLNPARAISFFLTNPDEGRKV